MGGELPPGQTGAAPEIGSEQMPQNLETQEVSYLNIEGQKFLIEDKNDFLQLMKYIKLQNKNKNSKPSEFMEEIGDYGKKHKIIKKGINPYYFLNENNEFGGLIEEDNKVKLYEGSNIKEFSVLNGWLPSYWKDKYRIKKIFLRRK